MDTYDLEKRIYIGECGCVRVESKHFRVTMQPEQFVVMLREIAQTQREISSFNKQLTISNNVSDSGGFVTIQKSGRKKYE